MVIQIKKIVCYIVNNLPVYVYIVCKNGVKIKPFTSKAEALQFKRKLEPEEEPEEEDNLKRKPTVKRSHKIG